jgi:hypothetical protein
MSSYASPYKMARGRESLVNLTNAYTYAELATATTLAPLSLPDSPEHFVKSTIEHGVKLKGFSPRTRRAW